LKKSSAKNFRSLAFWAICLIGAIFGVANPCAGQPHGLPDLSLSNPVLLLQHTRAQITFERAPRWVVQACNTPPFHEMWIFAATARPEGTYILDGGSIWVREDVMPSQPPVTDLQPDGNGGINLLTRNDVCEPMWDADNAFNDYFPDSPGHRLTAAQAEIIHDLAVDLIAREMKIFGGSAWFFKAMAATGDSIADQDAVLVPLLRSLQAKAAE